MSVHIQLDNPNAFYTNLDFISGKIILSLVSDENVSAINVKIEGESRTLLMRGAAVPQMYRNAGDRRPTVATENHKLLYRVQTVFPSSALNNGTHSGLSYTLRPGIHEYPFRFKIPFNNGCSDPNAQGMGPGSGFGGFGLSGIQQMQYRHVKKTLPPSLTGFPGEAEVRYYIKVTVQRPSLFKENRRSAIGFKFMPIEPPRVPPNSNEVYARRPYVFQAGFGIPKKKGMFGKKPPELSDTPPKGELDARLPSPAVLTCNKPLPLRLILRKTADSPELVFLQSMQIVLIGTTTVRAQDVLIKEPSQWVMMSLNGLSMPIGKKEDPKGTETVVDSDLWNQIPLPNTVAPSFDTCNLARSYELEVRVGLAYGLPGDIQPQMITLPLRFRVEIFSGITPPAALLDAIASRPTPSAPSLPHRPVPGAAPATADHLYPPQLGTPNAAAMDEAPPSYEDAMADEIAPTDDGPRPAYSGVTDENAPAIDEKGAAPQYSAHAGEGSRGGRR